MPSIHLTTFIEAPADRVFNLSRSIALHKKSMEKADEQVVAGIASGLIGLEETVTWKARHLGKKRIFKTKVVQLNAPHSFTDEMMEGDFRSFRHEHHFKQIENGTILIDLVEFEPPYGSAGKLFSKFYLTNYLRRLLEQRNKVIKEYAESNKWQPLLL